MKQALKFLVALCVAIVILFAVRARAVIIYTVPTDLDSVLRKGDRVLVNRMACDGLSRGDLVAFSRRGVHVGRIVSLPGDTVVLRGAAYVVPSVCCGRCPCADCRFYVVSLGAENTVVHTHEMMGRASKLFHLPW